VSTRSAFLYAAARTPFGRYAGALSDVRPDDLAAVALTGMLAKVPELDPIRIGEVVWGNANGAGEDNRDVGRTAVLLAGLPVSVEPQRFGIAPVEAAERALSRAGIGRADVGAVELNESFAVQSLACVDAWKIDPQIVNAKGGVIAIGHPLGASGGRLLGTLAHRLRESGERWGVAAICLGVGQGLAVVLENQSGRGAA